MFFEPTGKTGWMVGRKSGDDASPPPLLWKTTDGGATWKDISVASFATASSVGVAADGGTWLESGFALDAKNIWIAGHDGLLMHHDNGGE